MGRIELKTLNKASPDLVREGKMLQTVRIICGCELTRGKGHLNRRGCHFSLDKTRLSEDTCSEGLEEEKPAGNREILAFLS